MDKGVGLVWLLGGVAEINEDFVVLYVCRECCICMKVDVMFFLRVKGFSRRKKYIILN